MNIIPKLTVALSLMVGAIMATSCADDIETGINPDPTGNAISFTPAVGHSTRATETTIKNLGDFEVVARGIHPSGLLYDNFLIGSVSGGARAKKNADKGTDIWTLSSSVYWPSAIPNMLFFAYTALKEEDGHSASVLGDASFSLNGDNPHITGFKPQKTSLDGVGTKRIWADGEKQKDLLVAFTEQARADNATEVALNFTHTLTQVSIYANRAGKADDDHRIVKIKGAWIVNATEGGNLLATFSHTGMIGQITNNSWVTTSYDRSIYGSFYTDIVELDATNKDLLHNSLMLIPEDLTAWNRNQDDDGNEIANNNGAYIMLLCRVELIHEGKYHTGSTESSDVVVVGNNHYHQMFPVNEKNEFNGAEYGFVCVPLSTDWNTKGIGKRYTYYLNICGSGTGAGKYPPVTEEQINKLIPSDTYVAVTGGGTAKLVISKYRPTTKKVGDNVLDDPIQFKVSVSAWEDLPETNWSEGTGPGTF